MWNLGKRLKSKCYSLSRVRLFVIPWTAVSQASPSITNSWSLLKLMSIESVMPSNHLILYCPLLLCPQSFPASGSFQMSQLFASGGQRIGVSASTSVLPMNTQDWFPFGWTGWIQGTLKSLLQHHSSKASVLLHSAYTEAQSLVEIDSPAILDQFGSNQFTVSRLYHSFKGCAPAPSHLSTS